MIERMNAVSETIVHASGPVVFDAGRRKKREIKELREGFGTLAEQVRESAARAAGAQLDGAANEVLPVVLLYRKRRLDRDRLPRHLLA
jgi:hypothetical protein